MLFLAVEKQRGIVTEIDTNRIINSKFFRYYVTTAVNVPLYSKNKRGPYIGVGGDVRCSRYL